MKLIDLEAYLVSNPVKTILLHLENSLTYVELIQYLGQKDLNLIFLNPRELVTKIYEINSQQRLDLVITNLSDLEGIDSLKPEKIFLPRHVDQETQPEFKARVSILSSGTENLKLWTFNLKDLFLRAKLFVDHFELGNANFILSISFASIAGLNLLLRAWQSQGSIEFELEEALSFEDTVVSLFPTQLRLWHKSNLDLIQKLEAAQIIFLGGEPLDPVSEKIIQDYNLPVVLTYALTEAGGTVACKNIFEDFYQGLPEYTFKIEKQEDVSLQNSGQLIIERLEHDHKITIPTNDFVELISDSQIKSISRKKTFVNRGGFKFELGFLERKISQEFEFQHLTCLKFSDDSFGERVICFYQGVANVQELEEWSKANLAVYLQPEFREVLDWPVLCNGKTNLRELNP